MGRNLMEIPAASWAEFRQLFSAFFSAVLGNTVIFDGVKPGNMSAVKHYGVCSTAAATAEKAVTCAGFTLVEGAKIAVKFTVTNTAANPTLNANSTGAKAIYYRGAAISAGYLAANRTYQFVYNGTQYELVGDLNTDTNNVTAQNISTTNATYPILLGNTANATANIGNKAALFGAGVKVNPSTSEVIATKFTGGLNGKAASAEVADNAAKVNNLTVETAVPTNAKFTDTTYSNFVKSGSGAKAGLVPAPSTTAGTTKYLCEDGTWQVPPNTTYSNATTSTAGLMSADDKTKLSSIASGAQANTVTGVKGNSESAYRTGNINITKANIGLGNVDNTADSVKSVSYADNAGTVNGLTVQTAVPANAKFTDTKYSAMSASEASTGTATTARTITAKVLADYVAACIATLVNSAPAALDTLQELADALGNDPNFATTMATALGNKLDKTGTAVNAEKVNNLTVQTAVPANAKFTDTTYSNFVKSGSTAKAGLVPAPSTTAGTTHYLREDGTWVVPPNTTYGTMTAATADTAGTAGLVPAPGAGEQAQYLRGDGTWQVPTNTNNATAQNISTANNTYPILLGATANATANIGNKATYFGKGVKVNPSTSEVIATKFTGALVGNVTGNVSGSSGSCTGNAATATKATGDKNGADITTTYVKNARIQQGTATIYNKFVVAGGVIKAVANSRNIQITESDAYNAKGRSTFFADGGIHTIADGETAAVPTNSTSAAVTYYACLVKNGSTGVYELKVQSSKTGVLSLYRITVPANNTASNLNSVTITDERRIETSYGQLYVSRPYASVALPTAFSSTDYDVELRATSWSGVDLGELLAYDLANNGFKVEATGAADNINVRWMATAKS